MMFSQNVFSAKDVLGNSTLCDSNMWDSQPYSQVSSYSQNSQLSSMDLFSQHKGSDQSRFDHYQRSQSQTTEDDPLNYYSKYANNPPLFQGSSNDSSKSTKTIKDLIKEQKLNISFREERDMFQTFVNLLKDYTNEVNSVFENFKGDIETSYKKIEESVLDGVKNFDDDFKNLKDELMKIIDNRDKESDEKEELKNNLVEQKSTIKVLESKVEILEKQLKEANDKESAYVDQRIKYHKLEQKYLKRTKNWNFDPPSFLGNTPPPSQNTDPLCTFLVPHLQREGSTLGSPDSANYKSLPHQGPPSTTSYGFDLWEPGHHPGDPLEYYNPQIMASFQMNSTVNPPYLYCSSSNVVPSATSHLYPSDTAAEFRETSHLVSKNSINYAQPPDKPKELGQTPTTIQVSHKHKELSISGCNTQKSSLVVARRSTKKSTPSPMAMVRPQVRRSNPPVNDDERLEIFLYGIKEGEGSVQIAQNATTKSSYDIRQQRSHKARNLSNENELVKVNCSSRESENKRRFKLNKSMDTNEITEKSYDLKSCVEKTQEPGAQRTKEIKEEWKSFRREESVRRKRSFVSMLGMSSDDLEVQEITNSIKAQQRKLVKRIKSSS